MRLLPYNAAKYNQFGDKKKRQEEKSQVMKFCFKNVL